MENQKPINGQKISRYFDAQIRAKEGDSRTVELSFSSEAPVSRWYGTEILAHDPDSIDTQRLLDVGTVLFGHGRDVNAGIIPIAKIDRAWIDETDRKGRAEITFDTDDMSERLFQKVKNGFIRGVSVGYAVSVWEEVKSGAKSTNGRFIGPAYIATRWAPYEISIEPTPADPDVGVGRSQEDPEPPIAEARDYGLHRRRLELKTKI